MTKLFLASILAVGLSFPLVSHAEINALGVSVPVERTQVNDNLRGGYVATGANDSLRVQTLSSESDSKGGHVASSAADSFVVQKLSNSAPQS